MKSWLIGKDWCWEGFGAGGEGDDRGWDDWMASPTRWMWVWVNSGSWRWTGRPGVLWFMGSQRVGHNWVTELNWILCLRFYKLIWRYLICLLFSKIGILSPQVYIFIIIHISTVDSQDIWSTGIFNCICYCHLPCYWMMDLHSHLNCHSLQTCLVYCL